MQGSVFGGAEHSYWERLAEDSDQNAPIQFSKGGISEVGNIYEEFELHREHAVGGHAGIIQRAVVRDREDPIVINRKRIVGVSCDD